MFTTSRNKLTLTLVFSLVGVGIITACSNEQNQTASSANQVTQPTSTLSNKQPNIILKVNRQAGKCPDTVGVWNLLLPLEGGAEHTVIANTYPFAGRAKLVSADKKTVEYSAPMTTTYASCVASAKSETPKYYNFQFRNGKVYFRVDLRSSTLFQSEITFHGVGAIRPYVGWLAGE